MTVFTGIAALPAHSAPQVSGPNPGPNPGLQEPLPIYRVRPGDELSINVYRRADLSRVVIVSPDGKISFPFAGEITVAGMTTSDLQIRLKNILSKELADPMVTVSLTKQSAVEVNVIGAVGRPGRIAIGPSFRLVDLLAAVGGVVANGRYSRYTAILVRTDGEVIQIDLEKLLGAGDLTQNVEIRSGDTLLVREREGSTPTPDKDLPIQILGEVNRPGGLLNPPDTSLLSLVTSAGGFTPRALLNKAVLLRGDQMFYVDLTNALVNGRITAKDSAGKPVANLKAQAGDFLIVPANKQLFAVIGAINRPGPLEYPQDEPLTLLKALTLAGGISSGSDLRKAYLVRSTGSGQPEVTKLNLEALFKGTSKGTQEDIAILPGDVIFIEAKEASKRVDILTAINVATLLYSILRR